MNVKEKKLHFCLMGFLTFETVKATFKALKKNEGINGWYVLHGLMNILDIHKSNWLFDFKTEVVKQHVGCISTQW